MILKYIVGQAGYPFYTFPEIQTAFKNLLPSRGKTKIDKGHLRLQPAILL